VRLTPREAVPPPPLPPSKRQCKQDQPPFFVRSFTPFFSPLPLSPRSLSWPLELTSAPSDRLSHRSALGRFSPRCPPLFNVRDPSLYSYSGELLCPPFVFPSTGGSVFPCHRTHTALISRPQLTNPFLNLKYTPYLCCKLYLPPYSFDPLPSPCPSGP